VRRLALLLLLLAATTAVSAAPRTSVSLDHGWQVRIDPADTAAVAAHPQAAAWLPAIVPGSVQRDLIAAHIVPDPSIGTNEAAIQWAGLTDWQWRTTITVTPAMMRRDHLDLVFDGLDTFATVRINGTVLITGDNAHRRYRADAKPLLNAGANTITVAIASPIRTLQPMVLATEHALPGEYDSAFGDEPAGKQTSAYIRKPKYEYGWDWGPRFVLSGIWRPVSLEAWDDARIEDLRIDQQALTDDQARLTATLDVVADRAMHTVVSARVTAPDGGTRDVRVAVSLVPGANAVAIPLTIDHPQRWWPAGYGRQPRYRIDAALGAEDSATARIGLRTIELIRDDGAMGFRINGVPIFAKGANLIPLDSFPSRVTPARMRALLDDARAANMNMLRVWGGGY
jgi:beta-mannosidase